MATLIRNAVRSAVLLAVGAGVMYLMDPVRGRARRAVIRDKTFSEGLYLRRLFNKAGRQLVQRSRGLWAQGRRWFQRETVSDDLLIAHARTRLGHIVSHPHAVVIDAQQGNLTLAGPILQHEIAPLLAAIQSLRGVREVYNLLEAHPDPGNVSALQGQPSPRMMRGLFVTPAARASLGMLGGFILLQGLRQQGLMRNLSRYAGLGLLAWGFRRSQTRVRTHRLSGSGMEPTVPAERTSTFAHHALVLPRR